MNFQLVSLVVLELCVKLSNCEHSLDDKFLQNVFNDIYSEEKDGISREKVFLSRMWPAISSLIPQTIKQEHMGISGYGCSEIEVSPKVGKILNIDFKADKENKKTEVEAQLDFMDPLIFKIREDCSLKEKSPLKTIRYLFKGVNTVKFSLLTPDFNEPQDRIVTDCIIIIESVAVEKLGERTVEVSGITDSEGVEKEHWNGIEENEIKEIISISIITSLLDELMSEKGQDLLVIEEDPKPRENDWVCLNKNLYVEVINFMEHQYEKIKTQHIGDSSFIYDAKVKVRASDKITKVKINIFEIEGPVQVCIENSVEFFSSLPIRDVMATDFFTTEPTVIHFHFPKNSFYSSRLELQLISYAPVVFRHLRDFFGMSPEHFVTSFCKEPLRESSSAGNSGSTFYISQNKEVISKTIEPKELYHITSLLPHYVLYVIKRKITQTLLPKFYGFWTFKQPWKETCLIAFNNIFPSNLKIHHKYDLKGSSFNRKVGNRGNTSPTFRDMDFREHHPDGIYLYPDDYEKVIETIKRDCKFLREQGIMDYSLLLGLHYEGQPGEVEPKQEEKDRVICLEDVEEKDKESEMFHDNILSGIPAWTATGKKLILYLGLIDILQTYKLDKKIQHYFLRLFSHPDGISLHNPRFYARRLINFFKKEVFVKLKKKKSKKAS